MITFFPDDRIELIYLAEQVYAGQAYQYERIG